MSTVWQTCHGADYIRPVKYRATRMVESQEQIATTKLVDTLEEQHLLENLLEATKPPKPMGAEFYHYLIWTPFRYPPLRYGSRFGQRMHRGIFYASQLIETALAECAYYRFVFISGLSVPLPVENLTTAYTTFEVQIKSDRGVALEVGPFIEQSVNFCDPSGYETSQLLGSAMREAGVETFTYSSVRAREERTNVAVFTLSAIISREPEHCQQWICRATAQSVSFVGVHRKDEQPFYFQLEQFLQDGCLPVPACV